MLIKNKIILDDQERTLILRGVNLGGDSKIPFCNPGDEIKPEFLDTKNKVSFVGRPFPEEEAESHFKRLKKSGMNFLRFLVTWEALEHEGPGIYDEAYLAYLRKILLAANKEGISVFIDPHQDAWSRWTGGDGAPAWTMEKIGMAPDKFDLSGAAVTKQRYETLRGRPYPKMLWPTNYNRYAAATMFTLFFAGNTYAPDLKIDEKNIQDWLQDHYIAAFKHAQRRLKSCEAIKGWGVMNEPHCGFAGHQNLENAEDPVVPISIRPSPWQTILAASGYTVKVPVYGISSFGKRVSSWEIFNSERVSIFNDGFYCPWKQAGVWKDENGEPQLLKKDHFSLYQGRKANFANDFLKPFTIKYINAMKEADERSKEKNSIFFIEGLPKSTREDSHPSWNKDDPENTVNAFHWYDGFSLYTKSFKSWFNIDTDNIKIKLGKKNIISYFTECLAQGIKWTKKNMGNMPCLLGEFGLAFDMNNKSGFKNGDYKLHEEALSMYYDAADANLLHSTIWNYSASNTNKYGDGWNDEDLSIFSEGKERAAAGWKRPYPMATSGKPLSIKWDRKKRIFTFCFNADSGIKAPTIIYFPIDLVAAPPKAEAITSKGKTLRNEYNADEQRLLIYNDEYSGEVTVTISQSIEL